MIGNFIFNGINAYEAFGLICKSVKRPIFPALKANIVTFSYNSKIYDFGYKAYELFNLTMKIQYLGESFYELRARGHAIGAWLGGPVWRNLSIIGDQYYSAPNTLSQVVYKARVEEEITLDTIFEFGEADITFTCQPLSLGKVYFKSLVGGSTSWSYIEYPHTEGE